MSMPLKNFLFTVSATILITLSYTIIALVAPYLLFFMEDQLVLFILVLVFAFGLFALVLNLGMLPVLLLYFIADKYTPNKTYALYYAGALVVLNMLLSLWFHFSIEATTPLFKWLYFILVTIYLLFVSYKIVAGVALVGESEPQDIPG